MQTATGAVGSTPQKARPILSMAKATDKPGNHTSQDLAGQLEFNLKGSIRVDAEMSLEEAQKMIRQMLHELRGVGEVTGSAEFVGRVSITL